MLMTCSIISCQNLQPKKETALNTSPSPVQSLKIDKKSLESLADGAYVRSQLAFLQGDTEQAFKDLKTAQTFAPHNSHFKEKLAHFYQTEGLSAEALRLYKQLEKSSSHKKEYRKKLTQIYALNGLYRQALKYHQLVEDSSAFYWQFQKAVLLDQLQDSKKALKEFEQLDFESLNGDEKVRFVLFQSYLKGKLEEPKQSLQSLNQLFEIDCPEEDLLVKVLDRFKRLNQPEKFLAYIKKWELEKGVSPLSRLYLLNHFLAKQDWDLAFFYAQELEDFGKLEEEHYFYIANYLMEKNEYSKATPYLKDLIAQKPQNGYYRYLLAFNYGKNQEWEKAMATYQKVPAYSSYFLLSQLQMAHVWEKQGEPKKSLALLERLSKDKKTRPQVLTMYAKSLWLSGAKKKALSLLAQALRQYPKNKQIMSLMSAYAKQIESPDHKESRLSQNL